VRVEAGSGKVRAFVTGRGLDLHAPDVVQDQGSGRHAAQRLGIAYVKDRPVGGESHTSSKQRGDGGGNAT
jgi:hypothetical protein